MILTIQVNSNQHHQRLGVDWLEVGDGWGAHNCTMQVIGITCMCGPHCASNCEVQSFKMISCMPWRFHKHWYLILYSFWLDSFVITLHLNEMLFQDLPSNAPASQCSCCNLGNTSPSSGNTPPTEAGNPEWKQRLSRKCHFTSWPLSVTRRVGLEVFPGALFLRFIVNFKDWKQYITFVIEK